MLEAPLGLQGTKELSSKGPTVIFGQNLEIVAMYSVSWNCQDKYSKTWDIVGAVAMHSDSFACN